jgi:hypothetical protein
MRKVKLDTKSEKSANAFSGNENSDQNAALSSAHSAKILELKKTKQFYGRA